MSPINGANPLTSILQDALDQARQHGGGGHGGRSKIRQLAANEDPEATKQASQLRPRAFAEALRETDHPEPAVAAEQQDDPLAKHDEQRRQPADQQPDYPQDDPDPQPEENDAIAVDVLAQWLAMNPGGAGLPSPAAGRQ